MSLGYFVYDFLLMLLHPRLADAAMLVHHVVGIASILVALQVGLFGWYAPCGRQAGAVPAGATVAASPACSACLAVFVHQSNPISTRKFS